MTLYLTDHTGADEIVKARQSGFVIGIKYYPAGATTNSESGVTDLARVWPVLAAMEKAGVINAQTVLIEPTSGRVLTKGETLHGVNSEASVVFQTFALYPWLTVEQNVAVGLMARDVPRAERDAAVERAIAMSHEKYCSASIMLGKTAAMTTSFELLEI